MSVIYTGVFATKEERDEIVASWRAENITVEERRIADHMETIHRIALRHGLPEIPGRYGFNSETREFLGWEN